MILALSIYILIGVAAGSFLVRYMKNEQTAYEEQLNRLMRLKQLDNLPLEFRNEVSKRIRELDERYELTRNLMQSYDFVGKEFLNNIMLGLAILFWLPLFIYGLFKTLLSRGTQS